VTTMKAYVIVAKAQRSIFGRTDADFYGAIWFYPSREQAERHCGPAGEVVEIEVTFPDDVTFNLAVNRPIRSPFDKEESSEGRKT
jgi:hypothetical protein